MLSNEPGDRIQLTPTVASCLLEGNRIQPEFSYHIIPTNMHMRRLSSVVRYEEKPIGAVSQNSWHIKTLWVLGHHPKTIRKRAPDGYPEPLII